MTYHLADQQVSLPAKLTRRGFSEVLKVVEHSFGSLCVHVICQIMARERLQLTSWNLAVEKYTDKRFWLTGKMWRFCSFRGNMNNLKLSLFLSLHKICSLDFPINLHTAYYILLIITIWNLFDQILTDGFLDDQ